MEELDSILKVTRRRRGGRRVKHAKPLFAMEEVVPFAGEKQVNVSPTVAAQAYLTAIVGWAERCRVPTDEEGDAICNNIVLFGLYLSSFLGARMRAGVGTMPSSAGAVADGEGVCDRSQVAASKQLGCARPASGRRSVEVPGALLVTATR